jgi:NAD(P)H dehydrogenase (quinone)
VHDLSGDVAWSFPELTAVTGREIMYKNVSSDEHLGTLLAASVPPALAEVFVANYRAIAEGGFSATPGDLHCLIGRPTTTLAESVAATLTGGQPGAS